MGHRDEFREWNKEKHVANRVIVAVVILAVFVVGIGCFAKINSENKSITMTSEAVTAQIDA